MCLCERQTSLPRDDPKQDGSVAKAVRLVAAYDTAAIDVAKSMLKEYAVELWDSLRFVEHFDVEGWGRSFGYTLEGLLQRKQFKSVDCLGYGEAEDRTAFERLQS